MRYLLALTLALAAGSAWGKGYTTLQPPPSPELSHLEIIEDIYGGYGGTWEADGLLGFKNDDAGITVKRVYDLDDGNITLHVLSGDENGIDQVWTDGVVTVTAEAKYAWLEQSFGWNGGGSTADPSDYIELLTEADVGNGAKQITIDGEFLWGLHPTRPPCGSGRYWWSLNAENADDMDHMLTYFVEGLPDAAPGEAVWLLFWEDLTFADIPPSDADYNDFVIEVRAIPEPGTFLFVAAGLTGLAASRRRQSRS